MNLKKIVVVICGLLRMYKVVFEVFINYGYWFENIYVIFERKMKCGIGKCGYCNVGMSMSWKYVCKDGFVFGYFDIILILGLFD